MQLTWGGPAASGPLDIYEGTNKDICEAVKVHLCAVTNKSALVADLANGTPYYFWLVDKTSHVVSNMAQATLKAELGAPAGLAAVPGDGQVTLSWSAPPSPSSPIYEHKVYWGTTAGFNGRAPAAKVERTSTSYTVTGLVNGITYCFWVTTVNGGSEGLAAEASAVPGIVPGPPAGLAAVAGNGQVTLSWAAPASDGGYPVTGYNVYQGTSPGGETGIPVSGSPVTATSYTVTGLANGTTYYFKVTAVNQVGEGPGAEANAVPVTAPEAPAGLAAVAGNGQVTLTWAAPASDGGSPVTGYIIYQGTNPGGETGTPVSGSPVTATSYTVTGLVNGTTYYFKVTAVNAAGLSPLSEEASATLQPIPPSSAPPSSAPPSSAPPSSAPPSSAPPSSAPAFAAPTGLTAAPADTQVHLSWTAPASDGGSPVISYKVYVATTPGVQGRATTGCINGTDATVTGLLNGTVYYFMVTAVNGTGSESPFSTEVSAEPLAAKVVSVHLPPPTAPTRLIALLAAVAAMAAAAVFTLIARRRWRFRGRSRQQMAVPPDVRAVPDTSRPDVLGVRDTGQEPTHTVRLEPQPGVPTTTIKESGHDDR